MKSLLLAIAGGLLALSVLSLSSCASKNKAKEVDTKIDNTTQVTSDSVIGVKSGDMVYQRKVQMNEELRSLELAVYNTEARVYGGPRYLDNRGLYGVLKDCRAELGDVTNNGEGKPQWTEKREYVTPDDDFSQIGLENKKLVGVTEEYLLDRIKRFKEYKATLESRQEEYETKVKACEMQLAAQKQRARD